MSAVGVFAQPKIELESETLRFGKVNVGTVLDLKYQIKNVGDEVLNLTKVSTSCGCTVAGEWPETLEPGESAVGPVRLDTIELGGDIDRTVSVWTNDPDRARLILHIVGNVWSPIEVKPNYLYFPRSNNRDQKHEVKIQIKNKTETPMRFKNVRTDSQRFTAEMVETEPGRVFELRVMKAPPFKYGLNEAYVLAETSHPELPQFKMKAQGYVSYPVEVSPPAITVSAGTIKQPLKRLFTVRDNTKEGVKILEVSCSLPEVTVTPKGRTSTGSHRYEAVFPAGMEFKKGIERVVSIRTSHPDFGLLELPLSVYGRN